ncbi:MAG: GNAT family N-acetyltransferase [Sphingobacterium sp.]|uniref:GNAT family N-acetyltransferase n=1 Tax=Sphingobacterium sp. TaxID=341027 RepID=UPI00283D84AC|nr:GNAT family N-acetyltransferase [Sphingobacterium sp.]MDR3010943.1 GNAT family N-acetyltransferase [Sphingobacterium sp.]
MSQLTYRTALESDLNFLLDLRTKTMNPHLIASSLSTTVDSHMLRVKYKFEHASIIEYNRTSIGLLKIERKQDSIELIQIQIDPLYQGRGIGKKIFEQIINEANSEKRSITLQVLKVNKAQRLYIKLGFKIMEESHDSYLMKYSKDV